MEPKEVEVTISGGPPFGMRIKGGIDVGIPLTIESVTPGSKAANAGLKVSDVIISINGVNITTFTHQNASNQMTSSKDMLRLVVKRQDNTPGQTQPTQQTQSQQPKTPAAPVTVNNQSQQSKPSTVTNAPPKPTVIVGTGLGMLVDSRDNVKYKPYENQTTAPTTKIVTTSLGRCSKCKEETTSGSVIRLGERVWHPEHFTCHSCNTLISTGGVFEQGDGIYCKTCFSSSFAQKCYACGKPCEERYLTTQDRPYHVACFKCTKCGTLLSGKGFNIHNDTPHCMDCVAELTGIKCDGCRKAILPNEQYIEVLGRQYHSDCFNCAICNANLGKLGRFKTKDNAAVCPSHPV